MSASLSSRIAVAVFTCGLAFGGAAITPASAVVLHGGGHGGAHMGGFHGGGMRHGGGWHGHYARGYGGNYGYAYGSGGYYGDGGYGYYGGRPCLPVLGLVTGNYCNFYF